VRARVCVCVRERERETGRQAGRQTGRQTDRRRVASISSKEIWGALGRARERGREEEGAERE
jgi:hypothetical protein